MLGASAASTTCMSSSQRFTVAWVHHLRYIFASYNASNFIPEQFTAKAQKHLLEEGGGVKTSFSSGRPAAESRETKFDVGPSAQKLWRGGAHVYSSNHNRSAAEPSVGGEIVEVPHLSALIVLPFYRASSRRPYQYTFYEFMSLWL